MAVAEIIFIIYVRSSRTFFKFVVAEARVEGELRVWVEELTKL